MCYSSTCPGMSLHVISFARPPPTLVPQATNAGVRRPGYEARESLGKTAHHIGVLYRHHGGWHTHGVTHTHWNGHAEMDTHMMSHVHMLHTDPAHHVLSKTHSWTTLSMLHECLEHKNPCQCSHFCYFPSLMILPLAKPFWSLWVSCCCCCGCKVQSQSLIDKQMVWTDDSILPCGILHCWPTDPERSPSIKEIACWRLNWLSDFYWLAFLIYTRYARAHMCCQCGGLLILVSTYHQHSISGIVGVLALLSLVPRPSKIGGGEGLVHTVCACV